MRQAIIDTNVYVHAIVEDSPLNIKAKEALDMVETWLTPIIVVYELVWVFRKLKLTTDDIQNIISTLLENPKVKIIADDGSYVKRALILLKDEKLDATMFNDKIILSIARHTNLPLATFDNELKKEAKRNKITLIPS